MMSSWNLLTISISVRKVLQKLCKSFAEEPERPEPPKDEAETRYLGQPSPQQLSSIGGISPGNFQQFPLGYPQTLSPVYHPYMQGGYPPPMQQFLPYHMQSNLSPMMPAYPHNMGFNVIPASPVPETSTEEPQKSETKEPQVLKTQKPTEV